MHIGFRIFFHEARGSCTIQFKPTAPRFQKKFLYSNNNLKSVFEFLRILSWYCCNCFRTKTVFGVSCVQGPLLSSNGFNTKNMLTCDTFVRLLSISGVS